MKFKSQVEGPVELLIAVIIMAITIAMGFAIYQNIATAQCTAQIKSEMTKLKDGMNAVSINAPPAEQTVTVILPNACGSQKIRGLHFATFSDPKFCKACGTTFGGCFQIIPVAEERKGGSSESTYTNIQDSVVCVELPGNMRIIKDETALCPTTAASLSNKFCLDPDDLATCNENYQGAEIDEALTPGTALAKIAVSTLPREEGIRGYHVTLRKSISLGSGDLESGQINICAEPI